MAVRRISHEPAYVLHRYDWSESSLILDVFTRHYGRIALVAKGAKKPSSNFRPVLLPLQPLRVSYGGEGEIRPLKEAEWVGGHVMPTGEALMAGYYLNELLIRLLARDDPHAALFDAYASAVLVLAGTTGQAAGTREGREGRELMEAALRAFELVLLREIGHLPPLDVQTLTLAPLQPGERYALVPEGGLVRLADADPRPGLDAGQWQALARVLEQPAPYGPLLQAVAKVAGELKLQLRAMLHYHCGVSTLRTRQLMVDLQAL